jgi:D-serine deaminase-like pyridoxal phosphate-dependent protein
MLRSEPPHVLNSQKETLPSKPRKPVIDLRTPALLVDLDAMEGNLQRMATYFQTRAAKLRPHFKAHQVFSLANKQIGMGAIGITCARLDQAEALVDQGIENVLIANEIAGASMIKHFVDLSRRAPVITAVDNPKVVSDMARLAGQWKQQLNVVVDLDVRLGRCGVQAGDAAVALAKLVVKKGLTFRGLMGYEGQVPLSPGPEKEQIVFQALKRLVTTRSMVESEGINVGIVTCGGTSDYSIAAECPGISEIQAGSYLLMDTSYTDFAPEFEPALTILATVISKNSGERIIADAGLRTMSGENGMPTIKGIRRLRVKTIHIEHTVIDSTEPPVNIDVGDKIEIWVHFLDPTLGLHNHMYGVRRGVIEQDLKIEHYDT